VIFSVIFCVLTDAFVHPGILIDRKQIKLVSGKIKAGQEPWKSALASLLGSPFAQVSYVPHPRATVQCGAYSKPDNGCTDERYDATAAYAQALAWVYTRNPAYAVASRNILDAWAKTNKAHTDVNTKLQVAWAAELFTRAAELIRHTTKIWPASSVKRFEIFLTKRYLPYIKDGRPTGSGGNWELSMAEGVMNIGVFTNNRKIWERGVKLWKRRTPAYIYLKSDGPVPVAPPMGGKKLSKEQIIKYWFGQKILQNGHTQETCRDFGHTDYGIGAIVNAAETARIQNLNLYKVARKRITAALELHSKYYLGASVPKTLCNGKLIIPPTRHTYEIAYNHYAKRLGMKLPRTRALLAKSRPSYVNFHMAFETLTHGAAL